MAENEDSNGSNCSGYVSGEDSFEEVNLSKKNLNEFPEELKERYIGRLDLSYNSLTDVLDAFSTDLPDLKDLNLSNNELKDFHKPACARTLKVLNLSHNKLRSIPAWLYMDSRVKLDVLDLSCNILFREYCIFYSLTSVASITYLNISDTGLTSRGLCALRNMVHVKKLDISSYFNLGRRYSECHRRNQLYDLNPAHLPLKLEELVARDVGLSEVPDISVLTHLRVLDLSKNRLFSPYKDFPLVERLEKLVLQGCTLFCISDNIGTLRSLVHIDLSHNQLEVLPQSLSELKSLKYLDLYDNLIEETPRLDGFTLMEKLDLAQNYFEVPDLVCGDKDYAILEENLRAGVNEQRVNIVKIKVEEEIEDYDDITGSECSDYNEPMEYDEEVAVAVDENKEEEIWEDDGDDPNFDNYVPYKVNFNSDCYDSDNSLDAYIAQCPSKLRESENFFVPASLYRQSKEVKMARKKAINYLPPPVPGQFDDA